MWEPNLPGKPRCGVPPPLARRRGSGHCPGLQHRPAPLRRSPGRPPPARRSVAKGDCPLPKPWKGSRLTASLSAEPGGQRGAQQQQQQAPGHGGPAGAAPGTARTGWDGTGRTRRTGGMGRTGGTGSEVFTPWGGVRLKPCSFALPRNSGSAGTG